MPPELGVWNFRHWTTRQVPRDILELNETQTLHLGVHSLGRETDEYKEGSKM